MKKFLVLITPLIACATAQPARCPAEPSCCACYSQELIALRQIQITLDRIEEKKAPKYGDFELGTAGGSWGVATEGPTKFQFAPGDVNAVPASSEHNVIPLKSSSSWIGTVDERLSRQATSAVKVPEGCKYDGWNFDCSNRTKPSNLYGHY